MDTNFKLTPYPTGCVLYEEGRTLNLGHAYLPPIRGVGFAAGVLSGPGDGVHGSEHGDEHRRARLLSRDEGPVRADGQQAGVAWLLPKDYS